MMGWVGWGEDFCGLGCVTFLLGVCCTAAAEYPMKRYFGLGFEKVTHDQLWSKVLY